METDQMGSYPVKASIDERGLDRRDLALLGGGIVLLAYNFRPTITSLPPIFPELQADLHLSALAVTVVASVPVLAFGVFAPVAVGLGGAMLAPVSTVMIWTGLLGLGQGAVMGLALYFTMARADSAAQAISLSAMAQCVGYLLATTGPLVVGLLHSGTGGWAAPFALLFVLTAVKLVVGLLAARARTLEAAGPTASPV